MSSTGILPAEDDTLTIYKLFTNLYEEVTLEYYAGFRHNKTKQSKANRKKSLNDNDDISYNSNNKNSNNNDYHNYNNNNNYR